MNRYSSINLILHDKFGTVEKFHDDSGNKHFSEYGISLEKSKTTRYNKRFSLQITSYTISGFINEREMIPQYMRLDQLHEALETSSLWTSSLTSI